MAYVRLDKIGKDATVVSFKHTNVLENGMFVELGKLGADKDSYIAKDIANVNGRIVLNATVAFDYTETMKSVFDFRLQPGKLGRGYILAKGNVITVDLGVLTASDAIEVGNKFQPAVGKKLVKVSDITAKLGFEVIDLETIMGVKCAVLEVL